MKKTPYLLFSTFLCVAHHAAAQQANVNLDWNPHQNTQNLTPYGANVISPEVRDDRTVTFRVKAADARSVALTGGPVLPTMACRVQMIRKGEKTKAKRVAGSSVFHVVQGQGRSVINGQAFDWEKGDIIALPSWAQHDYACTGGEDAILFSISDRPVLEALGFYREDLS